MGDIINLRNVRKRKAREDSAREADENRIRHGRSKAEKTSQQIHLRRESTLLDAHRRERSDGVKS